MNIDKHELMPVLSDITESLDIMKAFLSGEIKPLDTKRFAKNGCRRLARAEKTLGKAIGIHVE